MNVRLVNRLTGKVVAELAQPAVLGQYRVLLDEPASLNCVRAESGDFLVPDQEDSWTLADEVDEKAQSGSFRPNQFPPSREQESLRQIGAHLQALAAGHSTWEDWAGVSPVVPDIQEKAKMRPLDAAIEAHLHHLQEVCRHPRIYLKQDVERVPVSYARRIPSQAVEYLASHTEDWQHRKLTSVVPLRVLSVLTDDQLDIYENRVAARLVDHLHRYVRKRLEEVTAIDHELHVRLESEASHWRRRERVFGQLGPQTLESIQGTVLRTRKTLERLHWQIVPLLDSYLYKAIPRGTEVAPTLRATNIFANDRHYRFVALLWSIWLRDEHKPPATPTEQYHERQELCRGFDWFCALLVCRALVQLGFKPKERVSLGPGARPVVLYDTAGHEWLLNWNEDDTLTIERSRKAQVRFVPLVAALARHPDVQIVEEVLGSLVAEMMLQGAMSDETPTGFEGPLNVILYSSDWEQRQHLPNRLQQQLQSLGNDLTQPSRVGMLPVSTYEIDSVERVARAIRWVVLGSQILEYPPRIPIPVYYAEEFTSLASWLRRTDREDSVNVIRLPSPDERRTLDQRLADEKLRLSKAGKVHEFRIGQITRFEREYGTALEGLASWLRCPVCSEENDPRSMKADPGDHFECYCVHCESSWGTRACGHCGRRFPFLAVGGSVSTQRPGSGGWVDDVKGMDVLAVPCWLQDREGSYICPWCGRCRNADGEENAKCPRCGEPSAR